MELLVAIKADFVKPDGETVTISVMLQNREIHNVMQTKTTPGSLTYRLPKGSPTLLFMSTATAHCKLNVVTAKWLRCLHGLLRYLRLIVCFLLFSPLFLILE